MSPAVEYFNHLSIYPYTQSTSSFVIYHFSALVPFHCNEQI